FRAAGHRPHAARRPGVFLSDHIDRGTDGRGVLEQVMGLAERCVVVPLRGTTRRCCSPPSKASPNCATGSGSGARRPWLPTATEAGRNFAPPTYGRASPPRIS